MFILSLWLPIVVSAIIVFVASALVWMILPWHKTDFRGCPNEDAVRAALRGLPVGRYLVPYCPDPAAMKTDAMRARLLEGPQALITIMPNGLPAMAPKLVMSFVYYLAVGIACAYLLSRTIGTDAVYLEVFRVTGTVAFLAYGLAHVQESIWFARPWSSTLKSMVDALIYGLLTGGAFGWLA